MLTEEEKRNIRPLDKSIMVDTCNGPIVIDSYVELELEKLGALKPIRFNVNDNSPNLISIGRLVLDDGYKFHWEGRRARLVSPRGDVTWIDPVNQVPEMDIRSIVVNKIQEIEGDMLLAAKLQKLASDAPPTDAEPDHRPFNQDGIPKGFFYVEIFQGSGGLTQSLNKKLESAGRQDVQVIGFDLLQGRCGDVLCNDTYQRIMALINSGWCLGV